MANHDALRCKYREECPGLRLKALQQQPQHDALRNQRLLRRNRRQMRPHLPRRLAIMRRRTDPPVSGPAGFQLDGLERRRRCLRSERPGHDAGYPVLVARRRTQRPRAVPAGPPDVVQG